MGKAIYFASDFHLGVPNHSKSLEREKIIVKWLDDIKDDAQRIFLMGDVFDFWFEYRHTVPKYYVRLLGKLAELTDSGIQIDFFTGNHDMWAFNYLTTELNIKVHREPIQLELQGKNFFIGHGDGLGPGDYGYKFIKKVFANSTCQWLFARLHPNFGIGMANFFSRKSRAANPQVERFIGEENEWLLSYCREKIEEFPNTDYFVFGHRHLPLNLPVKGESRYFNLGDWFYWYSYLRVENGVPDLLFFENRHSELPQNM
ncbi:MAG: UDP-2,3-diacylglucosamine diphosphatase [Bacteroidia bacterium]